MNDDERKRLYDDRRRRMFAPDGQKRTVEDTQDRHQKMKKALDSLPKECRDVLLLKYIDFRTDEDISLSLGISLPEVTERIQRGKDLLRKAMKTDE